MNSSCVDGNYDESENDEMMTVDCEAESWIVEYIWY